MIETRNHITSLISYDCPVERVDIQSQGRRFESSQARSFWLTEHLELVDFAPLSLGKAVLGGFIPQSGHFLHGSLGAS